MTNASLTQVTDCCKGRMVVEVDSQHSGRFDIRHLDSTSACMRNQVSPPVSARCKHLSLIVPCSSINESTRYLFPTWRRFALGDITRLLSYNITAWRDWRDVQHFFESCLKQRQSFSLRTDQVCHSCYI